jgi:ketosteroid isomerase-like protein
LNNALLGDFKLKIIMKNKILKGGFLVVIAALSIACNQKKEEPIPVPTVDKEQIKAEIQAIENAFAKNYNTRDASTLTYYAEDATSFFNGSKPLVGRDAILQSFKENLSTFRKGVTVSFVTNEVFISNDANHVVEIGGYQLKDSTDTKIESGNYMSLFEKRNGKYVCIRDMSNLDSQPLDQ